MIRALQTTTILPSHVGCVIFFKIDKDRGSVKATKHVEDNDVLDYKGESKGLQNWFSLSLKLWNSQKDSLENSHRLWNTERIWKTQQDTKRPWHVMTDHFSLINPESLRKGTVVVIVQQMPVEGWCSPLVADHSSKLILLLLLNPCMHNKPLQSSSHVLLHDGHQLLLVLLRDGHSLLPLCHLLLRLSCRLGVQCWSACEGTGGIW